MLRLLLALYSLGLLLSSISLSSAFQSHPSTTTRTFSSSLFVKIIDEVNNDEVSSSSSLHRKINTRHNDRRSFLTSGTARIMVVPVVVDSFTGNAYAADEAEMGEADERARTSVVTEGSDGSKLPSEASEATPISVGRSTKVGGGAPISTAYDFGLPISGISMPFQDIIKQEKNDETGQSKVKVILISNMKGNDPVARTDIPAFIALAAKYGRTGELAVILSPTDQGYYEPDTSQVIRLKLASEYGYGLNPVCVLTDKVNMVGAQAVPFWRWLQSTCRTPAGVGRVEGNFEKFLIDGRTGLPLRRYPRRYNPTDIQNDIEAIVAGRSLPPAGANFREEWISAAVEAEQGTYRFKKGFNDYDEV